MDGLSRSALDIAITAYNWQCFDINSRKRFRRAPKDVVQTSKEELSICVSRRTVLDSCSLMFDSSSLALTCVYSCWLVSRLVWFFRLVQLVFCGVRLVFACFHSCSDLWGRLRLVELVFFTHVSARMMFWTTPTVRLYIALLNLHVVIIKV